MLKGFFETGSDPALFEGLKIMREKDLCEKYMGKFPVISISLKSVDGLNYEAAVAALRRIIGNVASHFGFLAESGKLGQNDKELYLGLTAVKDGKYLMLHRTVKENDVNKDKWIGVGGHFEPGESPEDCLLREVKEETGLTLTSYRFRGLVTFTQEGFGTEYMCLYTADGFTGELTGCEEGDLEWVRKDRIKDLRLWDGDVLFLSYMAMEKPFFSLKLEYQGDLLVKAELDGKPLELFEVLNEDGTSSGHIKERSLVHRDGDWHGTVHTWIARRRPDGGWQLLFQKRSSEKESFPGKLDISSAGHRQAGEEALPTAVRELKEELGLE